MRLTRESREAQSLDLNQPCSNPFLQGSYTRFSRATMTREIVQGWMSQL